MAVTLFSVDRAPGLFPDSGDPFIFDATLSENHSVKARYTREPLEDGSELSDHKINEQRPLGMVVTVSSAERGGLINDRHTAAWGRLVTLTQANPPPVFTVTTGAETLENVVLTGADWPRTPDQGNSMVATVTLVQLQFSQTDVAANLADAAQDLQLGEVDLGSQGLG